MTERDLSKAVVPDLDEARLHRQWAAIAPRIRPRTPNRARWVIPSALAISTIVLVLVLGGPAPEPSAWDGAIMETKTEPTAVTLNDGSQIELSGQSRLEVVKREAEAVELRVLRGSARFDVARDPSRVFSVRAGDVAVRVIGTRFSVGIEPVDGADRVVVTVERGSVECTEGDQRIVLKAGQSWSSASGAADEPREGDSPAKTTEAEGSTATEAPDPAPGAELPGRAPPKTAEPEPPPPSAAQLFEEANAARLSGDVASAAEGYRTLLAEHPGDARAGLAAFELGRLLQDRFGDPAGAAKALSRALRTTSGAGFKEDALARLVRAYATMGARDECERARGAYLESYPSGVHKNAVERACGHGR